MKIIAQHYDTNDRDFSRHLDRYCAWLENTGRMDGNFDAEARPVSTWIATHFNMSFLG
ncbi:hypothetical protein [Chitinophaga lutea]|uniref:hypothetical protein n=1 Tax=Chitinophaga lutea TaxID=2488634 RepID=UPI00131593EB|nr:hypothetical protein [Chitinophaga lutea]